MTADLSSDGDTRHDTPAYGGRFHRAWPALRRNWPIWLVACATLSNGLLSIVTVLATRVRERAELFSFPLPFGLYHWSRTLGLAFGFALIYLSFHLLHRRRTAWWLAVGGLVAAAAAHLGRGHPWVPALLPLAIVVLLLVFRKRFTVRSEPRSIAQGVGLMAGSVLFAVAYGTLGFWLLDKSDFGLEFSVVDSIVRTLRELSLVGNGDLVTHTRHARWFLESLRVVGVVAGAFAVYSLFRPVAFRLRTLPQQRALMKKILEKNGGSSLDYFKLWPDKSYFFSSDEQRGLAYRTVAGVALCLGDPAGPADGLGNLLRAFARYCEDNGWALAFHQAQPHFLPLYREVGLQALKIGEEAVVDLERFESDTLKHSKHMRHVRNRFTKEGWQFQRALPPHEPMLLAEAEEVSSEWLQLPAHHERSFSMGFFDRDYLNEFPLLLLRDPAGRLQAFANEIPSYQPGEATIDLMRHRLDAPNVTMDYLFIALFLTLHQAGYRTFNLGVAPYAGVGTHPEAPLEERVAHFLVEHLTWFGDYKGIRDYKGKFEPVWEERFLAYQGGPLGLVKTAAALVQATDRPRR